MIRDREFCPRGAARSARHPVTVEIVGSNPIEDVFENGTVRKRQSGEAQTFVSLRVQLPPVPLRLFASAGYWRTQVAVTHPPCAMQVRLLPDAVRRS